MSSRRRFSLLALSLPLVLGACVAWQPVSVGPDRLIADEAPERIRITTNDGAVMTIEAPAVRAGAVVGTRGPGAARLEDISVVEVERVSTTRTLGLVLPAVGIIAIVAGTLEVHHPF